MNYIELLKEINKAAKHIKLVNSVFDGDVYTNWNTETVSYGSVNIGLEDMTKSENTITYNLILYYGDRLLKDKSNMNSIWVDGFNVLQSIINGLPDEISYKTPITYIPFEQKFADYLAGVYVRVGIEVDYDLGSCEMI